MMDGQMIQWMNRRDFPKIIIELSLNKQSVKHFCKISCEKWINESDRKKMNVWMTEQKRNANDKHSIST